MSDELTAKIDMLHARMSTMELTLAKVSDALVSIARIEERIQANSEALSRAFSAVQSLSEALHEHEVTDDERMRKLEEVIPVHKLVSGWVLAWVVGAVSLLSGIVIYRIFGTM